MSWEVLTMRSVTSFFNPALARSDLRRHWPILFLYTAIWMVALPVQLYLRHIAEGASYGTRTVSEVCQGTYSMGVIMAFVFGGVLAMALYSYLMNGRSVGLIHSLPLKRQTLFFTQLLTGFAMLTAGNLLVVLVGEPAGVRRAGSAAGMAGGSDAGGDLLSGSWHAVRHAHRLAAGGACAVCGDKLSGDGSHAADPLAGGAVHLRVSGQ